MPKIRTIAVCTLGTWGAIAMVDATNFTAGTETALVVGTFALIFSELKDRMNEH